MQHNVSNGKKKNIDLSIHNFASAKLAEFIELPDQTVALIRWHGMIGQFTRGEVPLKTYFNIPNSNPKFLNAYFILNIVDTAALREGLMTHQLLQGFTTAFQLLENKSKDIYDKKHRAQRFANLRRRRGEEKISNIFNQALESIPDKIQRRFIELFDAVSFWYCESALASLSAITQLKAIAFALGAADRANATNLNGFDISFHSLSLLLNEKEAEGRYRLRLLEATFSNIEFIELFTKGIPTEVLVGMEIQIGKQKAIRVEFGEKEEANALVTLLRIYETKSTAQFHVVLKMLCDLYGLRKDTFDRVANEQEYLKNMNSARTDKARMLDYALPGTIIEIGPGGGVVLDLISKRFPGSDIIGIDVSQEVVDALNERALRENATSQIRFGDAFELPTLIPDGYDTVIFCSILHEIYSYVVDPKSGKKFEKSNCYTWGPASFPYEVREQYGILNYADYISEIHDWLDAEDLNAKSEKRENWKRHCVEIPKAHQSYLQPGYKTGLASKVILLDENMNPVELPDSNCLIVFEKT